MNDRQVTVYILNAQTLVTSRLLKLLGLYVPRFFFSNDCLIEKYSNNIPAFNKDNQGFACIIFFLTVLENPINSILRVVFSIGMVMEA